MVVSDSLAGLTISFARYAVVTAYETAFCLGHTPQYLNIRLGFDASGEPVDVHRTTHGSLGQWAALPLPLYGNLAPTSICLGQCRREPAFLSRQVTEAQHPPSLTLALFQVTWPLRFFSSAKDIMQPDAGGSVRLRCSGRSCLLMPGLAPSRNELRFSELVPRVQGRRGDKSLKGLCAGLGAVPI
jgi:hypothetical protein